METLRRWSSCAATGPSGTRRASPVRQQKSRQAARWQHFSPKSDIALSSAAYCGGGRPTGGRAAPRGQWRHAQPAGEEAPLHASDAGAGPTATEL
ncbi:unnamed protein product [Phytophthora lilii]|uniref:Unnamed protein product n=1 Tax=Phytophthora lilii TaxID=2077276 RepID=A0A9W6WUI9_9STRA|nr:unnamed protein product [Phytophthora lilii]